MEKQSKIAVLGSGGLVGGAILRKLKLEGFENVLAPRSSQLNLLDKEKTVEWFVKNSPEYVFFSAAKVGGIQSNIDNPVEFGTINTEIINNTLHAAKFSNVTKLLFFGSSCIYPKHCEQPMKEEYLLSGHLEPTNEMYALSKIYGLKMCQAYRKEYGCNFISCQPCNIYGPGDNFDPIKSHVIAGLIRKIVEAKENGKSEIVCWGDGMTYREFLHCDDLAQASLFLMDNYNNSNFINIGSGYDISIKNLTELVKTIVGFTGNIIWDETKPNGMRKKLLDVTKLKNLGWEAKISLEDGIKETYEWYIKNRGK